MTALGKILVANRGEIACRVIRAARECGYLSVAIYSEADAELPHVTLADEAVCIGPPAVNESYLDFRKVLEAAKATSADAVHPGYGFLSENAEFSKACAKSGVTFIGPSAEAIHLMGNKAEAKRTLAEADVPMVPGYSGEDQSDATLLVEAEKIAYPLLVKAAAGGGGRGKRLVEKSEDLKKSIKRARSEALNAFGSDELILERAVQNARHVEIQIIADEHGTILHLGERDCSSQRRHQKVVEEAPCPVLSEEQRAEMGEVACSAARAINYRGAGTVEFLLDQDSSFYFLEMNTRLQVEHPITELVTGLDLVHLQFAVAAGKALELRQDDIKLDGWAIEARLYAENPAKKFLPQSGPLIAFDLDDTADGIRIDSGFKSGNEVSPYYDPMLAKIIAYGPNRESARRRLVSALARSTVFGVTTNKSFLTDLLEAKAFAQGEVTTTFIEDTFKYKTPGGPTDEQLALASALTITLGDPDYFFGASWSSSRWREYPVTLEEGDTLHQLKAKREDHQLIITTASADVTINSLSVSSAMGALQKVHYQIEGKPLCEATFLQEGATLYLDVEGSSFTFEDKTWAPTDIGDQTSDGVVRAPMNGKIVRLAKTEGETVARGDVVAVLEAMKMEHEITAPTDGTISNVKVKQESQVATRDVLLEITIN